MQLDRATRAQIERIGAELAQVAQSGLALPGTLNHRQTRCNRPGCKCMGDPPALHGPYWSWTRKIDNKTATRYLSADEIDDYGTYFDNAKRLRALLAELEALSLAVLEAHERNRSAHS